MDVIKGINATIAFAAEMAMLALLAIGGYNMLPTSQIGRWLLAILLPGIAIALWAYYLAPMSAHRLSQPWLCIGQLVLFTIAAAIAYEYVSLTTVAVFIALSFGSSIFALCNKQ